MATRTRKSRRGLTDQVLASGLVQAFGLDLVGVAALVAIGVTVYRVSPDLVWGYAGVLLLALWWAIGKARANAKDLKVG